MSFESHFANDIELISGGPVVVEHHHHPSIAPVQSAQGSGVCLADPSRVALSHTYSSVSQWMGCGPAHVEAGIRGTPLESWTCHVLHLGNNAGAVMLWLLVSVCFLMVFLRVVARPCVLWLRGVSNPSSPPKQKKLL